MECNVCKSNKLYEVLDLGVMPSANNLVTKEELSEVKSYPLKYFICDNCSLFQQVDFASRESLFSEYLYLTGASKVLVEHFKEMSQDLAKLTEKKELAFVIASNDGTELSLLRDVGFKKAVGIEPSGVADTAKKKGLETIKAFFTYELSEELIKKYGRANLVTANNVFAHIPDPKDMLKGMANLISDDGIISIEANWLKSIIEKLEIETLYAEHYFVWSIKAMHTLTQQLGLRIYDMKYMPEQHGGSLRFMLKKQGKENLELQESEKSSGLYDTGNMVKTLQNRADVRKQELNSLINEIKKRNKSISIWSVPAKVPTLLNFCGITNKEINYAYEIAETKIGKYIPKSNILIKDQKLIEKDMPDYLIVGAWNYWNSALVLHDGYMKKGGHLINPLTLEIYPSE